MGVHRHDIVIDGAIIETKIQKGCEFKETAYMPQITRYAAHKKTDECIILVVFTPNGVATRMYF